MKNTQLSLTKYVGSFIGDNGDTIKYQYIEIEFAPNCFAKFKLNEANLRVLQKYAPNMYQLLINVPEGTPLIFNHIPGTPNGITAIYSHQAEENEL